MIGHTELDTVMKQQQKRFLFVFKNGKFNVHDEYLCSYFYHHKFNTYAVDGRATMYRNVYYP